MDIENRIIQKSKKEKAKIKEMHQKDSLFSQRCDIIVSQIEDLNK